MPNDYLNNPVRFRLSSIMENYFFFCEGEDDHAASPHVQGASPRGPISKKKAPSALSMNTSLSHDTGSHTKTQNRSQSSRSGPCQSQDSRSLAHHSSQISPSVPPKLLAILPTNQIPRTLACVARRDSGFTESKTRMTNSTDLHHLAPVAVSVSIRPYLP
jgi:hypothetical protein